MNALIATLAITLAAAAAPADKAPGQEKAAEKKADKTEKKVEAAPAAPAFDLSKMGSASRKPKDEKAVKKEIETFLKAQEDLEKKQDMDGMLATIDFPVYMVTDDQKGVVELKPVAKDEYVAMMKPMHETMPKDMVMQNKYTIHVLSDAMALVVNDYTATAGKQKATGRAAGMLIKKDGKWMQKTMAEAGWGDSMKAPPAAAPATTPTPAPAPKK